MANNEYVNRVDFGDETLIDISDTTAEPEDVIEGQTFYTKSGAPATGILGDATTTTHGLMSAADKVKLDEIDSKKAPIIIDSKSGNPIVINDGVPGLKLYDMKVSFNPKQEGSGDPSPTNIRPINGWNGVTIYHTGKNMFHLNENEMISDGWNRYFPNPITKPGTYIFSCENQFGGEDTKGSAICFKNSPLNSADQIGEMMINQYAFGRTIYSSTVTITEEQANAAYIAFYCNSSKASAESFLNANFQLEIGTVKTDYEPYTGAIIPISWQEEAGIIYSGELDVLTGVLTVNTARADMGSATWTIGTNGDVHWFKSSRILTGAKVLSSNSYAARIVSDRFKNIQAAKIYSGEAEDNTIAQESINAADSNLRVKATSYNDDTDAFTAAMNGVYVYYELATPLTYQLTSVQIALLTGINTIWANTSTIEIAYPVDTKKYVDAGSSDVKDVRVDGTSVLEAGVAEIPMANPGTGAPGVVSVISYESGLFFNRNNRLAVATADESMIKAGTNTARSLVAGRQHFATFYGLSKAAGSDLANETVTVGQYPDSAKVAIAQMLGIDQLYSPMEEIANVVISQDSDEVNVTTDKYGNPFKLAHAQITLIFGTEAATINDYISASLFDSTGVKRGMPTLRLINGSKCWMIHNFMSFGGIGLCFGKSTATGNTQSVQLSTYNSSDSENGMRVLSMPYITGAQFKRYNTNTTPIIAGSRVVIYGCRVIE